MRQASLFTSEKQLSPTPYTPQPPKVHLTLPTLSEKGLLKMAQGVVNNCATLTCTDKN